MKKTLFLLLPVLFVGSFLVPMPASAAHDGDSVDDSCQNSFLSFPAWYKYLQVERIETNSGDSICQVTGPSEEYFDDKGDSDVSNDQTLTRLKLSKVVTLVALAIIDILLRLAGMVAFGFIVYSGFRFVLSQGNADQEKAARETAINALIGMVITIFAVAIVTFIGNRLTQ